MENKDKLAERKAFVDSVGIKRPIWKMNFCSKVLQVSVLQCNTRMKRNAIGLPCVCKSG